jgi:5-methylcytosine-specific restriction enzyme B
MEIKSLQLHLQLNEEILQILLEYRAVHPHFMFSTRVSNRNNRLHEGLWFQGTSNYVFVGFYKLGDGRNKTKTIGFVLNLKNQVIEKNYIEIVFPIDEDPAYVDLHRAIKDELIKLEYLEASEIEPDRKFFIYFPDNQWEKNLATFLDEIKPIIDKKIIESGLEDDFFLTESKFERNIARIIEIKKRGITKPTIMVSPLPIEEEIEELDLYPLNLILYGPPGTGKTFSTFDYAYKIFNNLPDSDEIADRQTHNWFVKELEKGEGERQVEFVTFHQNYSYEDFVKGIKPNLENDSLAFREHEGVFYNLCKRALNNQIQSSQASTTIEPTFEEVFDEFLKPYTESGTNISVPMKRESYEITAVNEKNLNFLKKSGGTGHTLSIKTIKELYNNERTYNLQGLGIYYYPLMDTLKKLGEKLTKTITKVKRKRYVLVIDEINRANISRVFGELITLIEEDKRWGNKYQMKVTLPDGKTKFTVPNNLYIIGTMNTADKSIALLDIALRRRFEFIPLYPDSSLVVETYMGFFEKLNEKIKEKKGIDFTIGHAYFMAKKNDYYDFIKTMNSKVIPLLNEYFYNARSNKVVEELLNSVLKETGLKYKVVDTGFQLKIEEI